MELEKSVTVHGFTNLRTLAETALADVRPATPPDKRTNRQTAFGYIASRGLFVYSMMYSG